MIACSGIKDPNNMILDGMVLNIGSLMVWPWYWLEASPNVRGPLWLPEGQ